MAEIFLARSSGLPGLQKMLVVKQIMPSLASDAVFVDMFLKEARIASILHHPNIVHTYEVGLADGRPFIAMEYLHGEDLRAMQIELSRRGERMQIDHALQIGIGVCAGLQYAHERIGYDGKPLEIVHRDVSPHNVFVTFDGAVKLLDFGVAKASTDQHQTAFGVVKGKLAYMSPEQSQGHPIDRRADVFSIGVVLYELTLGRRLFAAPSEFETLKRILSLPILRPTQLDRSYDPRLEKIIMRALAKDRAERYQTARELQADLEKLALERSLSLSASGLQQMMASMFPGKREAWRELRSADDGVEIELQLAEPAAWRSPSTDESASVPPVSSTGSGPPVSPVWPPAPMRVVKWRWRHVSALGSGIAVALLAVGLLIRGAHPGRAPSPPAPAPQPLAAAEPLPAEAPPAAPATTDDPPVTDERSFPPVTARSIPLLGPERAPSAKGIRSIPSTASAGSLVIGATPWCDVVIDGVPAGPTPLTVQLARGRHRLRLRNARFGIDKSVEVAIRAHEVQRQRFTFAVTSTLASRR
jgi:serine/threonine protein kinase